MARANLVLNRENGEYGISCGDGENLAVVVRETGVVLLENEGFTPIILIEIPDSLHYELSRASYFLGALNRRQEQIKDIIQIAKC